MNEAHHYHFTTRWLVSASPEEVYDLLSEAEDLVRWWPSVYLQVRQLEPGAENGKGKVVRLYTKGWLPYTLRWQFEVTEVQRPLGYTLEATGDFVGQGVWRFEAAPGGTRAQYDWRIRAEKPWLRRYSRLLKPLFSANHFWAMNQGEKSLKLELERRHAASEAERRAVPLPPGPTFEFLIRN